MTRELMGRLIRYTQNGAPTILPLPLCKALNVGNGRNPLPLKSVASDVRDGKHYFAISQVPNSRDVFLIVMRGQQVEVFLTDSAVRLRGAAIFSDGAARPTDTKSAHPRFQAELALFAKEAAEQLPP